MEAGHLKPEGRGFWVGHYRPKWVGHDKRNNQVGKQITTERIRDILEVFNDTGLFACRRPM